MQKTRLTPYLLALLLMGFTLLQSHAQRQMEALDRGLVVVPKNDGSVFVSWRLLGTEPEDLGFNVYRQEPGKSPVKLNDTPISQTTSFVDDKGGNEDVTYMVKPVKDGAELAASQPARVWEQNYLSIPLKTPEEYK